MKFIIDQQLPPVLAEMLRSEGFDAVHVRERALNQRPDLEIWAVAQREHAVVVSRDADFVRLHRVRGGARLIWVRTGNCGNAELLSRVRSTWPRVMRMLEAEDTLIELR